ncbi:MAG: tRNA preQ1(34) S-adenosylmethionine ribosyltransferase-isomerase QueA [Chloroflexi bacterium]|nr:tRNA preQ1(34) S-adenosylmethionine ribosyltransferase-isomerase QueA [Chloroflexota bacterium]
MRTDDFDYVLPPELIAQTPIEPRDASRLMVIDRKSGEIQHRRFRDLPEFLQPEDLLIYNESRVIPARLFARKSTGGRVEILLLRPRDGTTWETLVRGKHVRTGLELELLQGSAGPPTGAMARVVGMGVRGERLLAFDQPVLALADQIGATPLPPYIHTPLENGERYQTIYARTSGSAAAPTAGLHFTPELMHRLRAIGVHFGFVTLHVGLDTFRPVTEEDVEEHHIHQEHCTLDPHVARMVNETRLAGRRVIAVGTTSVRVLETAALAAVGGDEQAPQCPFQTVAAMDGFTGLFIYPGFRSRAVDAMITNFHLPRSTLLMLVAAYTGKELLDRAYAEAIERRYRFYSFGDAMLIL